MLNLNDKLFDILSHSIDWVKYAESKNGALIVLNTLIVIRLIFLMDSFSGISQFIFFLAIICFSCSIIISSISFIPVINYGSLNTSKTPVSTTDKLYDLLLKKDDLNYSPEQWLDLYCKQHEYKDYVSTKMDLIYAEQILIQKKIRYRKYQFFNKSLIMLILGFSFLLVSSIFLFV